MTLIRLAQRIPAAPTQRPAHLTLSCPRCGLAIEGNATSEAGIDRLDSVYILKLYCLSRRESSRMLVFRAILATEPIAGSRSVHVERIHLVIHAMSS